MLLRASLMVAFAVALGGCGAKGFLKQLEGKAYDGAARAVSEYCEALAGNALADQERLEARREIRQRGTGGPADLSHPILDDQTAKGDGPVVRIYCEGENVPASVTEDLVR